MEIAHSEETQQQRRKKIWDENVRAAPKKTGHCRARTLYGQRRVCCGERGLFAVADLKMSSLLGFFVAHATFFLLAFSKGVFLLFFPAITCGTSTCACVCV